MSRIEVVMPQMGESIAEGTIVKWHKHPGETVRKDETLLEISTDKVDSEIPSPSAGVLVEIVVPENQTVPVHTVVAYLESDVTTAVAAGPPPAKASPVAMPEPQAAPVAQTSEASTRKSVFLATCAHHCTERGSVDAGVGADPRNRGGGTGFEEGYSGVCGEQESWRRPPTRAGALGARFTTIDATEPEAGR